ncbi:VOC family protein [Nocardiopsis coralliicola]
MTTTVEYPSGAPAWSEASVTDVGRAAAFYGALLGWGFTGGSYTLATVGGRRVAGLTTAASPGLAPCPSPGPHWTAHLRTIDLRASLGAVSGLGGTVLEGPRSVAGLGTRALVHDPAGAVFALWEPGDVAGAEAFGVPGAPMWAEVTSADAARTTSFLVRLFGFEPERVFGPDYVALYSSGVPVCGVVAAPLGGGVASGPGAWLPFFAVADAQAAAEAAVLGGGAVLQPPGAGAYGRWALLADPDGARFAALEAPAL